MSASDTSSDGWSTFGKVTGGLLVIGLVVWGLKTLYNQGREGAEKQAVDAADIKQAEHHETERVLRAQVTTLSETITACLVNPECRKLLQEGLRTMQKTWASDNGVESCVDTKQHVGDAEFRGQLYRLRFGFVYNSSGGVTGLLPAQVKPVSNCDERIAWKND